MDENNDVPDRPQDKRALYAALDSFRQYRQAAHYNTTHLRRLSFYSLPTTHMDLLSAPPFSLPSVFDAVDDAIASNADLSEAILSNALSTYGIAPEEEAWKGTAAPRDVNAARSTLRQLYRDWSAEGAAERQASYAPILKALETHLPTSSPAQQQRREHRVLVPGAGLGRLAFELCSTGYTVEANELSPHQLLAAKYILTRTSGADQYKLYPWALDFNNHVTRAAQLQAVVVPDVHPASVLAEKTSPDEGSVGAVTARMTMTAGDFCEVYKRPEYKETFDAATTCFFLDTAANVITYIETVRHCLKPGGWWVNLGPLLWHFEPAPPPLQGHRPHHSHEGAEIHAETESLLHHQKVDTPPTNEEKAPGGSFELSDEEVVALVSKLGFNVQEHQQAPAGTAGYIQDPRGMLQSAVYRPSFWAASKRVE